MSLDVKHPDRRAVQGNQMSLIGVHVDRVGSPTRVRFAFQATTVPMVLIARLDTMSTIAGGSVCTVEMMRPDAYKRVSQAWDTRIAISDFNAYPVLLTTAIQQFGELTSTFLRAISSVS